MKSILKNYRIFTAALCITAVVVTLKYLLHLINFEPIAQTSLHNSVISSTIFVIGFVLSATISDYKESERIPAEFSSVIENMYEDAHEIHKTHPGFDLDAFRHDLIKIIATFRTGTRVNRKGVRKEIGMLNKTFGAMESAGVPPNFIVKLKQQQAQLLRHMFRVNYIQKINFIPSATFLVRSIVVMVVSLLLLTNIDPFYGGLVITGVICFIMCYMLLLIDVIRVPFHVSGKTRDDVSLFLLRETGEYLKHRRTDK